MKFELAGICVDGISRATGVRKSLAETISCLRMARIKPEALAVAIIRLFKTPEHQEGRPAVVEVIRVRGIECDGFADQRHSIGVFACLKSDGPEKMKRIRMVGLLPQNRPVNLLGLAKFSFSLPLDSLVNKSEQVFGAVR